MDEARTVGALIESFHCRRAGAGLSALADILEPFEDAPDEVRAVVLCHGVLADVAVDEDELNGALRRAQLLLATGGDPRRPLELDGRAVSALADDLDRSDRRERLGQRLAELVPELGKLPAASATLAELVADPALAWRGFAAALLADALADPD